MSDAVLVHLKGFQSLDRYLGAARDYVVDLAILLAAYLVATYLRHELPLGKYVGTTYQWHGPQIYLTLAGALAVVYVVSLAAIPPNRVGSPSRFYTAVAGVLAAVVALTAFVPTQSALEKGYFALSALVLVVLVLPWPRTDRTSHGRPGTVQALATLWSKRGLVRIWVEYSIRTRYAQAFLGILWIAALPLSTAFVLTLVFSHIMRIETGNVPFIAFFLAGFVTFGLFSQAVAGGMRSIIGAMGLINQIYFPREIIVVAALTEALVDTFFMFIAMIIIDAIVGVYPNPYWLIAPFLLLIEVALCMGVMLVVSWLSVLIRDIPQLVTVVLQMLFYLSPIIYPVSIIPHQYRFIVTLNPIGVLVDNFHRIFVYDSAPDWSSLIYPGALSVALLIFGYRLFKANEDRMADLV